jgi:Anti-sigma factor NepR
MTKSKSVESATSNPAVEATPNGASLDQKVLDTIGRALKAHYDDLVHAPLPQKFLDLLAQLEQVEQQEETQGKQQEDEQQAKSQGKSDAAG